MTIDLLSFIIVTVVGGAVGLILLYFVIKAAVKNALYQDREFQARVQRVRDQANRG